MRLKETRRRVVNPDPSGGRFRHPPQWGLGVRGEHSCFALRRAEFDSPRLHVLPDKWVSGEKFGSTCSDPGLVAHQGEHPLGMGEVVRSSRT